jgi:hypothetical protein
MVMVFAKVSKVLGLAGVIAPAVLLAGSAAWAGSGPGQVAKRGAIG